MTKRCEWCGMYHQIKCPLVKAIEFDSDRKIKRVEFFSPNEFPPLTREEKQKTHGEIIQEIKSGQQGRG